MHPENKKFKKNDVIIVKFNDKLEIRKVVAVTKDIIWIKGKFWNIPILERMVRVLLGNKENIQDG